MRYEIDEDELTDLLDKSEILSSLRFGDVDNWGGYDAAMARIKDFPPDLDGYKKSIESYRGEYSRGQRLYFNSNPCIFVSYLSEKIAVIVVQIAPNFDAINESQWCDSCNLGEGHGSHTCNIYDDVLEILRDDVSDTAITLIVDVSMLREKALVVCEHEKTLAVINDAVKEKKKILLGIAEKIAQLPVENEALAASIKTKRALMDEINQLCE
jgi:hypothetical protein